MTDKWLAETDKRIERLLTLVPKDRLECLNALKTIWRALDSSQRGWAQWISNTALNDEFSMEELEDIIGKYRELSLAFLRYDRETTEILVQKRIEKHAENQKKQRNMGLSV